MAETTVKAVFICTETNLTLLLHRQTSYHSARMISCLGKLKLGRIYQVGRDSKEHLLNTDKLIYFAHI